MPEYFDPRDFVQRLQELLFTVPEEPQVKGGVTDKGLSDLRQRINKASERLAILTRQLDRVSQPRLTFDPSAPEVIGVLIALVLMDQPKLSLGNLSRFYGSGVYAIYYNGDGDFPAYEPVRGKDHPLYVGKADPDIPEARTPIEQGEKLVGRLKEHARSILRATNLNIDHFSCRYLVVKSAWQVTAEEYLIHLFKPIWNKEIGICYGVGKHGDSATTRSNTRSPWDTLHMGRPWAVGDDNVVNPNSPEEIMRRIADHYRKHPPLSVPQGESLTEALLSFSRSL